MKYTNKTRSGTLAPWKPSTWPDPPATFNSRFRVNLERIINETVFDEIENVIKDARESGQGLVYRGHVVALAMFCAIDTLSSYAFKKTKEACPNCNRTDGVGPRYKRFIFEFFPEEYKPYAKDIYDHYRNSMVHSWNLFKVGISPGEEQIALEDGILTFGLISFIGALKQASTKFFQALSSDPNLQKASMARYKELKASALPKYVPRSS